MLTVALVITAVALQGLSPTIASSSVCTPAQISAGICRESASSTGDAVQVGVSLGDAGASGSSGSSSDGERVPVPTMPLEPSNPNACDAPGERCERPDPPAEPADPGFPAVTVSDLVSFRPVTPQLEGEPAGFGVVGMPANFVAAASAQEIPGVLLGYPVTVRFEPTAFVFSYGDGQALRADSGGTSWASSGSAQFTPTATGHVYGDRGTYTAGVTVEYAAWVDFGTGWRPVEGVVSASSGGYDVQVVEVRTALVDKTCAENPQGAGCG